jgi:hypothetical protein
VLLWLKDFEIRIPYLGGLNCSIREVIWLLIAKCSLHLEAEEERILGRENGIPTRRFYYYPFALTTITALIIVGMSNDRFVTEYESSKRHQLVENSF